MSPSYRGGSSNDWFVARDLLGTGQVRLDTFATRSTDPRAVPGGPAAAAPTARLFWAATAHGSGRQDPPLAPRPGAWRRR